MANERNTEQLTLKAFEAVLGQNEGYKLFAQKLPNEFTIINQALSEAGGKPEFCEIDDFTKGGNGQGMPEFIAIFSEDKDTIFICECKKEVNYLQSANLNKPKKYAFDGVIYYAKFLQKHFNVIALAVAGTDINKIKTKALYFPKSLHKYDESIFDRTKDIILSPLNYLKLLKGEKLSKAFSLEEVRKIALDFHENLREIKISERHKPIFIAGLLLALENKEFERDYHGLNSFELLYNNLKFALNGVLEKAELTNTKIKNIQNAIDEVEHNVKLKNKDFNENGSIYWYLKELELKIKPMMNHAHSNLDALGIFYHEFIRYTGGDGKGLGIVLTPTHLSEFMCEVAGVNKQSKVLDICCGSASFLVSAMVLMLKQANEKEISDIKNGHIYGIELEPELYTLANANMIIRRDGKSNIYQGDCFDKQFNNLKDKCNVGLLNPPYSQNDKSELEFVERLCELIAPSGLVCVVVPLSCAIGTKFKEERERIFKKHSLFAVFSMPDDIFYTNKANTNTCVMLWQTHTPHYVNLNVSDNELLKESNIRNFTYFGFYKDDGFVKEKKQGRIDKFGKWKDIKKEWVENYQLKKQIDGVSIVKKVTHLDEWLAEAYIKTDYSQLTQEDFEKTVADCGAFLMKIGRLDFNPKFPKIFKPLNLDFKKWIEFQMTDIFEIKRGRRLTEEDRIKGSLCFVTAGENDNGVSNFIGNEVEIFENKLTIDMFGNCFFHSYPFGCDDNILVLFPKQSGFSKEVCLFFATLLNQEKFRYRFGRQYRQKDFKRHTIKLPAKQENGEFKPDFAFMSDYIKNLKYSEFI